MEKTVTAIILVAGNSTRFGQNRNKNFEIIEGKEVLLYSLEKFNKNDLVKDIMIVCKKDEEDIVRKIASKITLNKEIQYIIGGATRQESVYNAITKTDSNIVIIHDGARPFLTEKILRDTFADAVQYGACVAAVPSKDTVKISDSDGFALNTPDRRNVWIVQTPQVFLNAYAMEAYECLRKDVQLRGKEHITVTDDASVVEQYLDKTVKMTVSSYRNIKITTPEDICIADIFCHQKE